MNSTNAEQLEKLAELKNRGVLSEEEFVSEKQKILTRTQDEKSEICRNGEYNADKFDKKKIDIVGFTKGQRQKELENQKKKKARKGWQFYQYKDLGLTSKAFFLIPKKMNNGASNRLLGKYSKMISVSSTLVAVLFVVSLFKFGDSTHSDSVFSSNSANTNGIESAINQDENKIILDRIEEFDNAVQELEEVTTKPHNEYTQSAQKFSNGEITIYEWYDVTKKAFSAAEYVWSNSLAIPIPDDLPDAYQEILEEARNALNLTYYMRKNGYEKVLQFLDENKPSLVNEAKDAFEEAQSHAMKYAINITKARGKASLFVISKNVTN